MGASQLTVRVVRKQMEAEGICSFELADLAGAPLPPFSAGSHIDVHIPGGMTRQYSLCNPPTEQQRYVIAVLNDAQSRGGSRAMHEAVQEGSTLQIGTPRNHFPLKPEAGRHLLLAGGIGITPMLCMAEALADEGLPFAMHYCARSRRCAAFIDHLAHAPYAERVQFHFDDEDPAQRLDIPALLAEASAEVHLYVCGPKGFMDAVLDTARRLGWADERLHYEFFAASVDIAGGAFEVKLASSGKTVVVPAEHTVAQALANAGVEVPVSCGQGICGTCLVRVLEGEPDHRDLYLSPEEQARNDQFTPCCSRARSPTLVLDL
ncbi:PDR/VanB family oxidoreductase [Cupriavidus basilensis]|uniref:PDR/VanB family oxidoreductase n=1 Tax=Cupriavidus basilensis TaxID=68895 RepID=A0ABT6AKG9_9BURK|nr:PDR/VanB family oxidoreductase [Cupriavidus basilensis]MDF3832286.1 PDR/VanB family oxidoreductase [Cupriavidus basilensis]